MDTNDTFKDNLYKEKAKSMAHIGLFCPPIAGHLNPMSTLGRALQHRGHRVTAFQLPGMEQQIERQQLEYRPLGEDSAAAIRLSEAVNELGRRTGISALRFTLDCARQLALRICEHGPQAVRSAVIDLLIVDDNGPAAGSVAQSLGLPFVNFGLIPLYRDNAVLPPFVSPRL